MQIQHFCKWSVPGCFFVTLLTFHRDMAGDHLLFAIKMRSNLKSRWNKTYCFFLKTCWMIAFVKNAILLHIFMAIATDWIRNQNLTIPWVCLTVPSKTTGPFWNRCKKPSLHCRYTWTKLAGLDQPSFCDAILWVNLGYRTDCMLNHVKLCHGIQSMGTKLQKNTIWPRQMQKKLLQQRKKWYNNGKCYGYQNYSKGKKKKQL